MNPISELEGLYFEMGELIDGLSEYDTVFDDMDFYSMIIRDYRHDNLMLKNYLSKVKQGHKGTLDNW